MKTARQRRALRQWICGTISLIGSASTVAFFVTFAALHDAHTAQGLQACMLGATGVALIVAIMALVVGSEQ